MLMYYIDVNDLTFFFLVDNFQKASPAPLYTSGKLFYRITQYGIIKIVQR